MKIGMVGCGFVADYYINTLPEHPELELTGVFDQNLQRAEKFSRFYSVPYYQSLEEMIADSSSEIILNLTNPSSHFSVSKTCLEAGCHVYSEKPFSTRLEEAKQLVELAAQKDLYITSAPCSLLGEAAQAVWKALQERAIGTVRLVYAEMDDDMIPKMNYETWLSKSGTPWPWKDEFEVGCTLEHAGYYITWLVAFFGPAVTIHAFADCLMPDKRTRIPLDVTSPDFSVACIKFASGVVARLTCSIIAPHDHSLKIVGDEGILSIEDCWYYSSPVNIRKRHKVGSAAFLEPVTSKNKPWFSRYKKKFKNQDSQQMDFARGVAELARAITQKRPCHLPADYCLHVNEIVLGIQNAFAIGGGTYQMTSTFAPLKPPPWD